MADYSIRYRDASGKPYDNVQSQDEYGRYYDAGGNVLGNSGQYQDAGQWMNDPDQSWLDYLGMKSKDVGGAAYNALANISGALSPVGTSEQGNMSLQVPPMVTGLVNSAKRIGSQGGFTGVEEFDAPLQQDLSNVVLSLYGGNALAGLAKPKTARVQSFSWYHGSPIADGGEYAKSRGTYWGSSNPDVADEFALRPIFEKADAYSPNLEPAQFNFKNPLIVGDGSPMYWGSIPFEGGISNTDMIAYTAKTRGHDGVVFRNIEEGGMFDEGADTYAALKRGTVKSPITGETLFSDNKPSIFGGALATAGEQPIRAYRGATNAGNIARDDASILWGSSSPDVASTYARPHFNTGDIQGAVAPLDVNFSNPLTVDAKNGSWVGLEHNGQRYTADDLATLARDQGHDGLIVKNVMDAKSWYPGDPKLAPADNYVALRRGTVKSPLTGETLFSRGVPLPPQQDDNLPDWLKF